MKCLFGMLLVLASAALASGAEKKEAANEELKKFAGTWALVSLEVNGKLVPADKVKDIKLVVKGGKATWSRAGKVIAESTFAVDPTKKPKTMDSTFTSGPDKGEKILSIYELDGDNLKVCSAQRPKEFSTKEGYQCRLGVYRRMRK